MSALPLSCVVDASVGIKLVLPESGTPAVRAYFARLLDDPPVTLFVPDLFFVECANILWKTVRRGDVTLADARQGLALLNALQLPAVPTAHLVEAALDLGCALGISAYDATYVALAAKLGIPLLTADERLANVLRGSVHQVVMVEG